MEERRSGGSGSTTSALPFFHSSILPLYPLRRRHEAADRFQIAGLDKAPLLVAALVTEEPEGGEARPAPGVKGAEKLVEHVRPLAGEAELVDHERDAGASERSHAVVVLAVEADALVGRRAGVQVERPADVVDDVG